MIKSPATYHASAERLSPDSVIVQNRLFEEENSFRVIMEAIPHIVTILNSCRQIVYANNVLLNVLGMEDAIKLLGQRPGEALGCVHSKRMPGGCGTSVFCRTCGAVNAILEGLDGKENAKECRITTESGTAFDFMVWAKPLDVDGERFVAFSVADISAEKRRSALERIFFHDILNTAGLVIGYADLIKEVDLSTSEMREMSTTIGALTYCLVDEIRAQQQLTAAEKRELVVNTEKLSSIDFVRQLIKLYSKHVVAEERAVLMEPSSMDSEIVTDRVLLQRVVGNMIKNALEASEPGEVVRIATFKDGDKVKFCVTNSGVIPQDVQLQIFQRSFSTKGTDRGLGTYSMKLLTEQFLKGEITFTSTEEGGTTFTASYPLVLS